MFKVPLCWYLQRDSKIDVYLKLKEEDNITDEVGGLLQPVLSDITAVFNKTLQTSQQSLASQGMEPQLIALNDNFFVSVDIQGFKCLPEDCMGSNPLKYSVCLGPPLLVENKTMMPLTVHEINRPGEHGQEVFLRSQIPPAMTVSLVSIDLSEYNPNYVKLLFRDNDAGNYKSMLISNFKELQDRPTSAERFAVHFDPDEVILEQGEDGAFCSLEMELEKRSPDLQGTLFDKSHLVFHASQAIKLTLYPKHLVVNRTQTALCVAGQVFEAYASEVLRGAAGESTIKITAPGFRESIPIDISTVGLTGEVTL